jgi:hypothetical protein
MIRLKVDKLVKGWVATCQVANSNKMRICIGVIAISA